MTTAKKTARAPRRQRRVADEEPKPKSILTVDIGGSKVKILATGQVEPRKARSGERMTPTRLVEVVNELAKGWEYEAVSIGRRGLRRLGKNAWRRILTDAVAAFTNAFVVDYIVLGGGNAKNVNDLPVGARLGHNLTAFRGGFRLWHIADVPTQDADGQAPPPLTMPAEWRVI